MARQEAGPDEYEVRNTRGWDRHMILAQWVLALLRVVRVASLLSPSDTPKSPRGQQAGSIPTDPRPSRGLTVPEIRRLWRHLLLPLVADLEQVLA